MGYFEPSIDILQVAFGCDGGKVLLFRTDELSYSCGSILQPFRVVNVNAEIKDLIAVEWAENTKQSYLVIASAVNVQLYDVSKNISLFHRSIEDGINTIQIGCVGEKTTPWLLCGGQSSFTGFDPSGIEVYWNVASDTVNAICFADLTSKSYDQIILGTADNEITLFDCEELIDSRNGQQLI